MLIGISGKMGSGKTTLANHLAKQLKGVRMSFADELRLEVEQNFGIDRAAMRDSRMKQVMVLPIGYKYMTLRELLQWWGAQRREADPEYWVKRLIARAGLTDCPVVIDDVRYANEAHAIQQAAGALVRLETYPGWESGPGADHASEVDLDDYDYFDLKFRPNYGALFPLAYKIKKSLV